MPARSPSCLLIAEALLEVVRADAWSAAHAPPVQCWLTMFAIPFLLPELPLSGEAFLIQGLADR